MKKQLISLKSVIFEMVKDRSVLIVLAVFVVTLVATFLFPFFELYPQITTKVAVPLHYNIHFGVDSFGPWWRVFMPTILGVVVLVVNGILAIIYWKIERMLSYFALLLMPILGIFLLLASVFITLLNLTYD